MPIEDFIINVFCCIDSIFSEIVNKNKLRSSGFPLQGNQPRKWEDIAVLPLKKRRDNAVQLYKGGYHLKLDEKLF